MGRENSVHDGWSMQGYFKIAVYFCEKVDAYQLLY
jgi:hypothetical protein